MMKKPAIFLLLAAAGAILFPAAAPGAELPIRVTGEGAEERAPQLQNLYLRLLLLFRLTPRHPVAKLEIALSPAVPAESPEYRAIDAAHHLIVCNLSGEFFSLPTAARRRLYGAMLLTQAADPQRKTPDFLPGWIALGLDQTLASSENSERWVRTNRLLPVLRALAGYGKTPSFAALDALAEAPPAPDPAAAEWIGELARCRFAFMRKEFFSPDGLRNFLRTGTLPAGRPETEYAEMLRVLAWNDLHPRPGALAAAALAPLETAEYPEVDQENKPTGKILRCRIEELGAALRKHPERKAILEAAADGWLRASRRDGRGVRRAAEAIVAALRTQAEHDGGGDAPDRKIVAALRELHRQLDRERELDALLDRTARENACLADDFRLRFRSVRRPSVLAAPEAERLLDEFAREDGR